MGIKHRADGGFRKFLAHSKLSLGGQESRSEMPYISYPRPLAFIIMNQQTRIKFFRIMLIENKFSIYESE